MNKLAAGFILFALSQWLPASAQTKPENNLTPRMRIYEPKNMTRQRAEQVARFVGFVTRVQIQWEPVVNGLLLNNQTGATEDIDKAEALLKRFDVPEPAAPPERQIEMTISLIRAYADAAKVQGSVPPELASVVKEMKGSLPYGGFSLVDTIQAIVRDGLKLEDALPSSVWAVGIPQFYSLEFHEPWLSADGKTVSVRGFRFGVKIPVVTNTGVIYQDEGISTPLAIHEGQKQVLGKVKTNPSSNDDLFVVLSCKLK
jgi:hypothetical protein